MLVSELGGSRGLLDKIAELGIDYPVTRDEARALTEKVKESEARGYQYEGADASLELLVRRTLPGYQPPFNLDDFWVVLRRSDKSIEVDDNKEMQAEAMVKVRIFGRGDPRRPRHADRCRRQRPRQRPRRRRAQGPRRVLPGISEIRLVDYKVRVIDSSAGTGASVRVLIECADESRPLADASAPARTSSRPHGSPSQTPTSGGCSAIRRRGKIER